ncbi:MAG: hypothetical protein HDT43_09985 [Ruminococcaceae bacterium]|nr:hypothetical protein [Oscillospiraceae bacterium]
MKKLNKAALAAIISASVIAAPFVGYYTLRYWQNEDICLYFKKLYPNAEIMDIEEVKHRGIFGSSSSTKKITLYDKEHNFYFDQTFYYEGLKVLPLDDANAYWREQYLRTAAACENVINAVPEYITCEYFTRYDIDSGANANGMFIFLKQPSAEEFGALIGKLYAVTEENYTPNEDHRDSEGYVKSTVIVLSSELYDKMKSADLSPVFEQKKPDVASVFKTALSKEIIRISGEDNIPPDEFYDGTLNNDSFICAEVFPRLYIYEIYDYYEMWVGFSYYELL